MAQNNKRSGRETLLWRLSVALSAAFALLIGYQWHLVNSRYKPNPNQVVSKNDVEARLQAALGPVSAGQRPVEIPTGVFIQSLKFVNSSEVSVSGYVWQKYSLSRDKTIKRGVIFPDAADAGSLRPAYRDVSGDHESLGWHFETTLRQNFKNDNYPLDHKTVSLRLWPADFKADIVLTPALADYVSTGYTDTFGINPKIVLDGWSIRESFFEYRPARYDSNFGLGYPPGGDEYPELVYGVVLKRNFMNAFMVHLVPLTVVFMLLFASLIMITSDEALKDAFGFSAGRVLGTCGAFFFVVLLAQIQIRQAFPGSPIVYLEYFYLIAYVVILAIALDAYFFAARETTFLGGLVHYRDNLIPKLMFWPFITGSCALITYLQFFR